MGPTNLSVDDIDAAQTFYCDDEDNIFKRFLSSIHLNDFYGMLMFFLIIAFPTRKFYLHQ